MKKKEFYPEVGILPVVTSIRGAREAREEDEKRDRTSIHLECTFLFEGETAPQTAPCGKVTFVVFNAEGKEVARKIPDERGKLDFFLQGTARYTIRPEVKKSWKVSVNPEAPLQLGDTVRITLIPQ
jgi:hypothetical protein